LISVFYIRKARTFYPLIKGGLGNAEFTIAASQPVSVIMDEVPMEKSGLKAFTVFDIANIEVARGHRCTRLRNSIRRWAKDRLS